MIAKCTASPKKWFKRSTFNLVCVFVFAFVFVVFVFAFVLAVVDGMSCSARGSCGSSCNCLHIFFKFENETILRNLLNLCAWEHKKGNNFARLSEFLALATSKTKLFCETSSVFHVDNIKNETIVRDFFQKNGVQS